MNKGRLTFCPRCGSTKVHWLRGLPQLWSLWECPVCGYRGAFILEDGKSADRLREEYFKKTGKKVDS